MNIKPESRLVLDPEVLLKDDVDRAILLARPRPLAVRPGLCHFLHPQRAVLLALFDGARTVTEVKDTWYHLLERPREICDNQVDALIDRYACAEVESERVLVDATSVPADKVVRYDPARFIVHRKEVNLSDRRFRKPYFFYLLPTMFCPQKCVYCYAKTRPTPETEMISIHRLREIFEEMVEIGGEAITLSGGDPFARKGIFEILENMVEAGLAPEVPTKAGLGYEQMLRLRDLGIDSLQVSVDSANPETIDRMVGVPGYHLKLSRLMNNLKRAGMTVRINAVLTPLNLSGIGELLDYLAELGNIQHVNISPYGRSMFCHRDELFLEPEQVEELRPVIEDRRRAYPWMGINLGGVPAPPPTDVERLKSLWAGRAACSANRSGFIILPDGRVTVCEQLYDHADFIIGDLRKQSVMEMWNSPRALALIHPDQSRVPDGACKTCSDFDECNSVLGRCWRDVIKSYGWQRHHYPDPRCPEAPPGPRLA